MASDTPEQRPTPDTTDARPANQDRAQALREMARGSGAAQADASAKPPTLQGAGLLPRRPQYKRKSHTLWFGVGAAILALIVIIVLMAHFLPSRQPGATAAATTVSFAPRASGLNNPVAFAWSPDNTKVAVVGYLGTPMIDSASYQYAPGALGVFKAHTGAMVSLIHVDDIIAQQITLKPPVAATPAAGSGALTRPIIEYRHLLWSPSGAGIALTFQITDWTSSASANYVDGVLFSNIDGNHARVVTYTHADVTPDKASAWTADGAHTLDNIPVAYGYTWGADGALTANLPLPKDTSIVSAPKAASAGAIGNPAGDQSFGLWQPGSVQLANSNGTLFPDVFEWNAFVAAWAPHGDALVQSIYLGGRMALPTDSNAVVTALRLSASDHEPLLALRGPAMAKALQTLSKGELDQSMTQAYLAWSPNGKWLAAQFVPVMASSDMSHYKVVLYNCATGEQVATLAPRSELDQTMDGGGLFLSWSPDGSHIALLDSDLGAVTIWPTPAALSA